MTPEWWGLWLLGRDGHDDAILSHTPGRHLETATSPSRSRTSLSASGAAPASPKTAAPGCSSKIRVPRTVGRVPRPAGTREPVCASKRPMRREIGLGSLLILVTALAVWALGVRPGAGILGVTRHEEAREFGPAAFRSLTPGVGTSAWPRRPGAGSCRPRS